MRIVVVGAGLAGLQSARLLAAAGVDVVLVEAGPRPGGRVRTVRAPFVGGQYSESGAEWVDSVHHRLLGLLDRYGIGRLGPGERWTSIRRWIFWDGSLLGPDRIRDVAPGIDAQLDEFDALVWAVAEGVHDPARPDLHADAARHDARSLADVADDAGLVGIGRLLQRRNSQGEFAAEPGDVSLLFAAQQRAHQAIEAHGGDVVAHRVDGGLRGVVDGLVSEVGDMLHLDEALVALEQDADAVTVTTNKRVLVADHVILATSLVPLRSVAWRSALPGSAFEALHGLGYGAITKTSVQWPRRAWPAGYATTETRAQRVYEPTADQPGEQGVLMAYCGGEGGREWALLDESARVVDAARLMAEMHGLDDTPVGGWSRAWSAHPRYGGAYAVYRPGEVTRYWETLRSPWGRVHLAGEHVATWTGYMEGALESAETVVRRLVGAG